MVGNEALAAHGSRFPETSKAQVDEADATFFGSTSGQSTEALFYLRWGKQTYANLRPCQFRPGYRSPMATQKILILSWFEKILKTSTWDWRAISPTWLA